MSMIFIFAIAALFFIPCGSARVNDGTAKTHLTVNLTRDSQKVFTKDSTLFDRKNSTDILQEQLIQEVDKYILNVNPLFKQRKKIAAQVVETALSENIDICFILAQGTIETSFGKTGIGRPFRRRSLFGVYKTYSSYAQCIEDYVRILKTYYLVNGRTERHLMNNYVTKGGSRYAGNRGYEHELKNAYGNIKQTTKIYEIQKNLKSEA